MKLLCRLLRHKPRRWTFDTGIGKAPLDNFIGATASDAITIFLRNGWLKIDQVIDDGYGRRTFDAVIDDGYRYLLFRKGRLAPKYIRLRVLGEGDYGKVTDAYEVLGGLR